jgi:hypothetical protein
MKTTLNWKKGTFKTTYEIYTYGKVAGRLKEKSWTQSADGELNGNRYIFNSKGFFKLKTEIIDSINNTIIGKISYNSWMTKARIEYSGKVINWKYDNSWNTKWSLFDSEGAKIRYSGSSSNGKIESDMQNDMLVLTGLYIANYNWQMTMIAVLTAVFIPIMIAASH